MLESVDQWPFAYSIGQACWDNKKCNNGQSRRDYERLWSLGQTIKSAVIRSRNYKFESFSQKKKKDKTMKYENKYF